VKKNNKKESYMGRPKKNSEPVLVGLCDHCGKIEHNKFKNECPDGYALYWEKLDPQELTRKNIEFKKLSIRYEIEKSKVQLQ
jgi:uncharacterized cysteine cluster protein YcgN (CxxCxxCC family)